MGREATVEFVTLADGTRVCVRPPRPADAEEILQGFLQLSSTSRYLRFLYPKAILTRDELEEIVNADGVNHLALVVLEVDSQGEETRGIAVGRFVRLPNEPNVAEPAITVLDEAQGRGIGGLLCDRLTAAARARGIRRFRCYVLSENRRALALLRHRFRGFRRERRGELTIVEVDL
ncbi:MAG: hypothetical protein Kow00109_12900 [Acidobacteriota bacterium]